MTSSSNSISSMNYQDKSMGDPAITPSGQCSKSSAETASGLSANVPIAPAHTAGDWRATGHDAYVNGIPCTSVDALTTENGFDLEAPRAVCYVVGDHFDEQGRANARLIAAAPDLLAACWRAKKYLEPDLVEPGRTVFWELVEAIKKATQS